MDFDEIISSLLQGERLGDLSIQENYDTSLEYILDDDIVNKLQDISPEKIQTLINQLDSIDADLGIIAYNTLSKILDIDVCGLNIITCYFCNGTGKELVRCQNTRYQGIRSWDSTYKESLGQCPCYICEKCRYRCSKCGKNICENCKLGWRNICEDCYDGSSLSTWVSVGTCEMCRSRARMYRRPTSPLEKREREYMCENYDSDFVIGYYSEIDSDKDSDVDQDSDVDSE